MFLLDGSDSIDAAEWNAVSFHKPLTLDDITFNTSDTYSWSKNYFNMFECVCCISGLLFIISIIPLTLPFN